MTQDPLRRTIAYFSMEAGLDPAMPTYAGGLGVLAGDTLRAAADMALPVAGVTLLHRQGYFRQVLDAQGNQKALPCEWDPAMLLELLPQRVAVEVEGRSVELRAWRYQVRGSRGATVPVYLLDAALPANEPLDRALTDKLYGGDPRYRLKQEVVLGFGGLALLRTLGYRQIETFHLNEGHCALLGLALLEEAVGSRGLDAATDSDYDAVRRRCVFTTHTPVPEGHDRFPRAVAREVLGRQRSAALEATDGCVVEGQLHMTHTGLFFSRYVNGVSLRHGEVSRVMFPGFDIHAITNGVHAGTWTCPSFASLFDERLPGWRDDNFYLRNAITLPPEEILEAHARAKQALITEIDRRTGLRLAPSAMTIGFARRAAAYKRAGLAFSDIDALRDVVRDAGPVQFVFAGKAHPGDPAGQALIRDVFSAASRLGPEVSFVYLEDYDMALAKLVCAGVDLWLNNPEKPQEASGTSGMKAALNGVPSLSVLDGWWVEGWLEGVTGWAIGDGDGAENDDGTEAASLYRKLRYVILPQFYARPEAYARTMRSAIAINGSYFNAQRMMLQYVANAYRSAAAGANLGGESPVL